MPTRYLPAHELARRLLQERLVSRIWDRETAAWGAGSTDSKSIATRLGWLDVAETMRPHLERVQTLGQAARVEGVQTVYLLGMGGSSLCAEVLRSVLAVAEGAPQLHVLDTTDEQTITTAAARLTPDHTWFLVASKSGATIEVSSMERLFWSRLRGALGDRAGRHFIAVTDPETALKAVAESRGYREVFINPADIGGRFSALSLFGLIPTALIGGSASALLTAGETMADGCRQDNLTNPGLELGAFIAATAAAGRDKLTVVLPPSLTSLGLWIEQLIAESTGKRGKGALPVVDEVLGRPDEYSADRAFVATTTDRDTVDSHRLAALEAAGHPVLHLSTRLDGLGAEFFRWEFATAVAGAALGINPFDEPNVSEAKEKTRGLLGALGPSGRPPESSPTASSATVDVFSSCFTGGSPAAVIRAAISSLAPPDYAAFLSYLPPDSDVAQAVVDIRAGLRSHHRVASTFGIGPRYLHSTGQYHKGGPNTVVAFVLTADDASRTEIPEVGYTFSVLKRAQALGDTETLEAHDRRTLRIHIKDAAHAAATLERLFAEAMRGYSEF
jgi:glucose-6-phosphate isomerase